jgi:hypothetical protein
MWLLLRGALNFELLDGRRLGCKARSPQII